MCEAVGCESRDQHRYESTGNEKYSSVNAAASKRKYFRGTLQMSQFDGIDSFTAPSHSIIFERAALAIRRCHATLTDILMFYTQKSKSIFSLCPWPNVRNKSYTMLIKMLCSTSTSTTSTSTSTSTHNRQTQQ